MRRKLYRQLAAEEVPLRANPFRSELVMEAFLVENQEVLAFDDVLVPKIVNTQLPLLGGRERRGTDGRIDILCLLSETSLAIIEVKRGMLTNENLNQLNDYLQAFVQQTAPEFSQYNGMKVTGILVGSSMDPQLEELIESGNASQTHEIVSITLDRHSNEEGDENYYLIQYHYFEARGRRQSLDNIDSFIDYQQQGNIPNNITDMAKEIHDYISQTFRDSRMNYRPGVITFNAPRKQPCMFVWLEVKKTFVKLNVKHDGTWPRARATQPTRYPDTCDFKLRMPEHFDQTVKDSIRKSYEIVLE